MGGGSACKTVGSSRISGTRRNAGWECEGGRDHRPAPGRRVYRKCTGPPSNTARWSADIASVGTRNVRDGRIFHVTSALMRMWTVTEATAFALPGQCSGVNRVISAQCLCSLQFKIHHFLCFVASVHLICGPRLRWSKQAIDWQV